MSQPVLVTILTFNEGEKLRALLDDFPVTPEYDLLFVDDGSTDGSVSTIEAAGHSVIRHDTNLGVGAGIRDAVAWARKRGYNFIVIMAGNGKMLPGEIGRLLEPITSDLADYVQGSRYLAGGASPNLPHFRKLAIHAFTAIVNMFLGFRGTDVTCGFRAYRLDIFDHPDIDITQDWLTRYELEYYLHYKVIKLDFRVIEVPVSMVYPIEGKNYSKIQPVLGWWSIIRPWIFLVLGLKK